MTKDKVLHCVLKKQWFEKIKSGEKTHEYREYKDYWRIRIGDSFSTNFKVYNPKVNKVRFTLGMTSELEKVMLFEIKNITLEWGENTDLKINSWVYDIELGSRLE